ncbi:hypothetical protein QTP88_022958 [Uroleucon formosanum]
MALTNIRTLLRSLILVVIKKRVSDFSVDAHISFSPLHEQGSVRPNMFLIKKIKITFAEKSDYHHVGVPKKALVVEICTKM